jgi:hypothetical protein
MNAGLTVLVSTTRGHFKQCTAEFEQLNLLSTSVGQHSPKIKHISRAAEYLLPKAKDLDGTPASTRMVRGGGDAARVKALLSVDATDCWHLFGRWWSCILGALPPSLW